MAKTVHNTAGNVGGSSAYRTAKRASENSDYRDNTWEVEQAFKDEGDLKGLKKYQSEMRYKGAKLKKKQKKRVENR